MSQYDWKIVINFTKELYVIMVVKNLSTSVHSSFKTRKSNLLKNYGLNDSEILYFYECKNIIYIWNDRTALFSLVAIDIFLDQNCYIYVEVQ